jgi:hypothetical protein
VSEHDHKRQGPLADQRAGLFEVSMLAVHVHRHAMPQIV